MKKSLTLLITIWIYINIYVMAANVQTTTLYVWSSNNRRVIRILFWYCDYTVLIVIWYTNYTIIIYVLRLVQRFCYYFFCWNSFGNDENSNCTSLFPFVTCYLFRRNLRNFNLLIKFFISRFSIYLTAEKSKWYLERESFNLGKSFAFKKWLILRISTSILTFWILTHVIFSLKNTIN